MYVAGRAEAGRGPPNPGVACACASAGGFTRAVGASGSQRRRSARGATAPATKDATSAAGVDAPGGGEDASVLSCASLRDSAFASGRSFRRDRSARAAGCPGPAALLPGAGASRSLGLRPE